MSFEKAVKYLENKGMQDRVIHLKESTATVAEAAAALGVQPRMTIVQSGCWNRWPGQKAG